MIKTKLKIILKRIQNFIQKTTRKLKQKLKFKHKPKLKFNFDKKLIIISVAVFLVISAVVTVTVVLVNKKKSEEAESIYTDPFYYGGFFVTYLNAGEGDCTFIHFANGKIMLIDTGYSESTFAELEGLMQKSGSQVIDYLVLTHPDSYHISNTVRILGKFGVGVCYLPDLREDAPFAEFNGIKQSLKESGTDVKISKTGNRIEEQNANVFFLYPKALHEGEIYDDIRLDVVPTEKHTDNLSPVIYIEYAGVKFLFSGDCRSDVEKLLLDRFRINYYDVLFDYELDFENIDFLLSPSHGAVCSNSVDFIDYIRAENIVISAQGNSGSSDVSQTVLDRYECANPDVRFLLTQEEGTVNVGVEYDGFVTVVTDRDRNT